MTQDQVKSELKDLRTLIGCKRDELLNKRYFELRDKYEIAIKRLEATDQLIFVYRIFHRKTYIKVGMMLHYSEEYIRKRWYKAIKQLAEILSKPRTNFDRITENVESLAEFMFEKLKYMPCSICPLAKDCGGECKREIKEWLQKENEQ